MRSIFRNLFVASAFSLTSISAHAGTTLNVLYAVPSNFKSLQEDLAARFHKDHPDITITFRNPAETYDSATAEVLRSAIIGDMPDVYFQGLNQLRVLVSQGRAVELSRFVSDPKQWDLDANRLHQRGSAQEGRRTERQAPGQLGRHHRARQEDR